MAHVRANAAPEMIAAASRAAGREVRWAGAALALGATLFVLGIILGLRAFEGNWDTSLGPTLPMLVFVVVAFVSGSRVTFWPSLRAGAGVTTTAA
jgi:hypothetical protein